VINAKAPSGGLSCRKRAPACEMRAGMWLVQFFGHTCAGVNGSDLPFEPSI